MTTCCVCEANLKQVKVDWCLRCPECGTWASTLDVGINTDDKAHETLNEDLRETGLSSLRARNNAEIVHRLREFIPDGGRLLDVGSAHGWFLNAATSAGFTVEGIEPDEAVARTSLTGGSMEVHVGYFPDVLDDAATFDVVTFNDVLEHLPDPAAGVTESAHRLNPGGLLSINIPNSRGLVYRLARVLHTLGIRSPFDRLWQVGLPSPHLWYFDPKGVEALCAHAGLDVVRVDSLDSATRNGLWERIHSDRRAGVTSVLG